MRGSGIMLNAYQVIGVGADAGRDEIRSAYINLAKQLHPDRNAGSRQAEHRLREVNEAYEVLKDPARRSQYDDLLRQSRDAARRSRLRAAIVMAASFALTTSVASALLLIAQPPQFHSFTPALETTADARIDEAADLVVSSGSSADPDRIARLEDRNGQTDAGGTFERARSRSFAAPAQAMGDVAEAQTWATYDNARFGFSIDYPADVFIPDNQALGDFWRLFVSRDGQARLLVTAGRNFKRLTSQAYRQSLLEQTYRAANLEYAPLRKHWFVLAGSKGEEMFYDRATFACDGRLIHRWRLTYPTSAREYYRPIIERIHLGYKHIRGMGPHCS